MRVYVAFTPYHLLLIGAIQAQDGDPDAIVFFSDEAGLTAVLPDIAAALPGVEVEMLPALESVRGLRLTIQSRRNDARVRRMIRLRRGTIDRVFIFNGLRSEAQAAGGAAVNATQEYVEDGLDAYLPRSVALGAGSRSWLLFHLLRPTPRFVKLVARRLRAGFISTHSALPYSCGHGLFPEALAAEFESRQITSLAFTTSIQRFAPLAPQLPVAEISDLYLAANTERVPDLIAYLDDVRAWAASVRVRNPDARLAVKPHPRERSSEFLELLRTLDIAVLPSRVPVELFTAALRPDCRIRTGPTTFVMTSQLVLPMRSIELESNSGDTHAELLRRWDPSITLVRPVVKPPAPSARTEIGRIG
jgi:hypothetical protein